MQENDFLVAGKGRSEGIRNEGAEYLIGMSLVARKTHRELCFRDLFHCATSAVAKRMRIISPRAGEMNSTFTEF